MKKILLTFALAAASITAGAQTDAIAKEVAGLAKTSKESVAEDSAKAWKLDGILSINASQTSLKNWAAGGDQQIGINILGNLNANYAKGKHSWQNSIICQYGALRLIDENDEFRKTDDKVQISSKYGFALSKKWYYSAIFDYKSQWAKGWTYNDQYSKDAAPGTPESIYRTRNSSCWSPLYLTYTLGFDYQPNEHFSLYISPLCGKTTIVINDELAEAGAFGVEPGDNVRSECGWYLKGDASFNITKQASLNSNITFFNNYEDGFLDEVDIDWNLIITFQVNKWLAFNFVSELIYDEDIAINDKDAIPHNSLVQFKDVIGVGLTLKF